MHILQRSTRCSSMFNVGSPTNDPQCQTSLTIQILLPVLLYISLCSSMKCNGVGIPPTDTHTTSPYHLYSESKTHTDLASIHYSPSMQFPSESLTTLQMTNWWFDMLDLLIKAGYLLWLTHRIPPSRRRQIHAWSRAWPVTGWGVVAVLFSPSR